MDVMCRLRVVRTCINGTVVVTCLIKRWLQSNALCVDVPNCCADSYEQMKATTLFTSEDAPGDAPANIALEVCDGVRTVRCGRTGQALYESYITTPPKHLRHGQNSHQFTH
jgi:hypothetical protein